MPKCTQARLGRYKPAWINKQACLSSDGSARRASQEVEGVIMRVMDSGLQVVAEDCELTLSCAATY